jgi:hypothetical protein
LEDKLSRSTKIWKGSEMKRSEVKRSEGKGSEVKRSEGI